MKKILVLLLLSGLAARATSISVSVGAINVYTGKFLSQNGATVTNGLIKVGFFGEKSVGDVQAVINGWSPTSTAIEKYNSLNSIFTQIGTAIDPAPYGTLGGSLLGLYSTANSGWNFSLSGGVGGGPATASYVDLALMPINTLLYIWAFNGSDFTFSSPDAPSEWALVTSTMGSMHPWVTPNIGTIVLRPADVMNTSDVLIGTDTSNDINMTATPEPSSLSLLLAGGALILLVRRKVKLTNSI